MANGIVNVSEIKADYITSKTGGDININNTVKGTGFVNVSTGVADAGKVPKLNASGLIDTTMLSSGTIDHTTLQNIGTNTHDQIDTHITSTSNPHSVTAAQVGNATAQWNANKLQGFNVDSGAPVLNDYLRYNGTAWEHYLHSNGAMYFNDNTTTTPTTTINTPVKVAAASYSSEELVAFTHLSGRLTYTGTITKKFVIDVVASFWAAGNDRKCSIYVAVNGSTILRSKKTAGSGASTEGQSVGSLVVVTLNTNDFVEIFFENNENADATTINNMYCLIREL